MITTTKTITTAARISMWTADGDGHNDKKNGLAPSYFFFHTIECISITNGG
jgi:hypothetical protein